MPLDLVLVLDSSGSMYPFESNVKTLARAIINQFDLKPGSVQIGLVEFDSSATVLSQLTFDRSGLHTAIDAYQAGGTTNIAAGLDTAHNMLRNSGNLALGKVVTSTMGAWRARSIQTLTDGVTTGPTGGTQWWGSKDQSGSITIDLESMHHVSKVTLYWAETWGAGTNHFAVLLTSGTNTTEVYSTENAPNIENRIDTIDLSDLGTSKVADKVTIECRGRNATIANGFALYEVVVQGTLREGVQSDIVLLTDGRQSRQFGGDREAISTAHYVKEEGATVVAVGFGAADVRTINAMASLPTYEHAFYGSSIEDSATHLDSVCSILASPRPPLPPSPPSPWRRLLSRGARRRCYRCPRRQLREIRTLPVSPSEL